LLESLLGVRLHEVVVRRDGDENDAMPEGVLLERGEIRRGGALEMDAQQLEPVEAQPGAGLDHRREAGARIAFGAAAKAVKGVAGRSEFHRLSVPPAVTQASAERMMVRVKPCKWPCRALHWSGRSR